MKRDEITNLFNGVEIDEAKKKEIIDRVMEINGDDVEKLKSNSKAELDKKNAELEALKAKGTVSQEDYDALVKYKADNEAKLENQKKIDFLKSQGCKHPELFIDKVDFTKATYNESKKTYEGLDLKEFKDTYKDMFEVKKQQTIDAETGVSDDEALSGVEKHFYDLNPNIKPIK